MTILSDELLFSYDQNVAAADVDSTNVIDTGDVGNPGDDDTGAKASHDIAKGNPVSFMARVTKVTTAGDLTVNVVTGSSVDVNGAIQSPVTLASTVVPSANVVDGALANLVILPLGVQRYLGLNYGITGDVDVTAGVNLGTQTSG